MVVNRDPGEVRRRRTPAHQAVALHPTGEQTVNILTCVWQNGAGFREACTPTSRVPGCGQRPPNPWRSLFSSRAPRRQALPGVGRLPDQRGRHDPREVHTGRHPHPAMRHPACSTSG
jgi:hypothetical protein